MLSRHCRSQAEGCAAAGAAADASISALARTRSHDADHYPDAQQHDRCRERARLRTRARLRRRAREQFLFEQNVDEPELVVHLGDYIYEGSWGRDPVRSHGSGQAITLDDYRRRYALYKTDADLQAAHIACPWLATWDDHEVENDYANDRSQYLDAPDWFLARRAAAYKAWYEHMPVPRHMLPVGPNARIYTRSGYGSLANFFVLDDRQYRSYEACPRPGRSEYSRTSSRCEVPPMSTGPFRT